ncbi:MAG: hypothetical protein US31_C0004G0056 [Berkelbacteria bacterium GW2011_GWA1_36_9]|uniref:Membrane protein 6-pyruvoyl-tetrahydropterin synthase-related domain-containing protein n=1 Tax=Berkelbacteria bacterium GW2011_GWA1_36_9 TaxID=1618331 RepID=A0A0G0I2I4_9BACT|nr:MAG: hypothetical protein US31_C0004G0056 [Berkelbacteria bacterium GW2011_GWA1_36_9]
MAKKLKIWALLILLIIPAFISLIRPGFFWMQDDLQAFRIQQLDKCISDLQIPCRWVPDAGYQYGYPQFNFYPPGVYYLGELFHLIGFQFIDAVKILFVLGFVLAALTMFIFLRSLFGPVPAFVGALIYTYSPYKAVDVYVRGALSEFWSFVFFPLIFWAIYSLIKYGGKKYLAWMGLSIGLLLTTHALMSMIFLPLAALWGLLWVVLEKKWGVVLKLIFGGLLGLGIGAFFILPAMIEKPFSHSESMLGGYFDWRQHFVDINQLFISNHWGYGSSYLGPGDDLSLSTGHILWIGALLTTVLSLIWYKKYPKISTAVFVLNTLALLVLFMTHQKSSFLWEKITILAWLQFPWRILADSIFLLTIVSSAGLFIIRQAKIFWPVALAVIIGVFVLYSSFFKPYEWFNISDNEKFSGVLWEKELTISIFDYLPIFAKLPPTSKAPDFPEIMDGKASFLSYQKRSNWQKGEVEVFEMADIRLPLFDFPGMKVWSNGKEVIHSHNDCRKQEFCLGLISFKLAPGKHIIKAELTNTPIRTLANSLTVVSMFAIALLFIKSKYEKSDY